MKKNNKIKLSLLLSIIIVSIYFIINSIIIGDAKFENLKLFLNDEQRQIVKKYIFPYRVISVQEQKISALSELVIKLKLDYGDARFKNFLSSLKKEQKQLLKKYILPYSYISSQQQKVLILNKLLYELESDYKNSGSDIEITESSIKLSNNKTLRKYKINSAFYLGIQNKFPGSGYIDFFENNIFILSSRGVLAFRKNLTDDEMNFKQIKNNIDNFIGIKQFKKSIKISIKDLLISNEKIYISYTEEIKEDCYNTGIISGNINYENINFEKLFSNEECIQTFKVSAQAGGRMVEFKNNHILLSVGDYRNRHLAQVKKSINGKIIKVNVNNGEHEIISMGHRNPQGLYFDKENNFILETEHGPKGGDEINLIEVEKINEDKIQNYGWAIVSAGEHYGDRNSEKIKKIYEKFPLYKSHSEHGFIEPLKSFVPSIAISEIVKIEKNKYVVASMGKERDGDKSLYFFELNDEKKIINLEQVKVFERVRDLRFKDDRLYLFMEDTPSVGVINLN
jgi:glucose/arabinose dehydrogenase